MKAFHKSGVCTFIERVRREARKKRDPVVLRTMGHERVFIAYDWGCDTFVFEKDVWRHGESHSPVLIVPKSGLVKGTGGYVLTLTTGNHTVAAIPLLSGQFWSLGCVPAAQRSKTLQNQVVCANVVDGRIEISQRDVPTEILTAADEWLQSMGFALDDVIMAERNDAALEYYRQQGQEWRVKPLAWTRREMEVALAASRTRINTRLRYYHSAKGVHFLTYPDFHRLAESAAGGDYARLVECLRELVSIFEGDVRSCMRTPKYHGHNEIELFGLRRGAACERIVPELERLMEGIALKRVAPETAVERFQAVDALFKTLLERPSLADEGSGDFTATLYMHLTGEVYHGQGAAISPTFDDRRTALPGATFRGGRPDFHPGADGRTRVLLANVEQMMSRNESVEYANIYEVRSECDDTDLPVGAGVTREIVFKTDRRPLCASLIEKRLALKAPGYGSYMLARVEAFKALGVGFGEYRLLMRLDSAAGREMNYFIRNRCPGEPLDDIPPLMFQRAGEGEGGEDPEVVLKLAALLGDAAAQNLALKKYLPELADCRFGVGKEVFEFGYDITAKREMPMSVKLCSIRGCFGWPDMSYTEENLDALFSFYFGCYAQVLHRYWLKHREAVSPMKLAERFFDGFEFKTREMHWNYSVRREQFDAFDPRLPRHYAFTKKWHFALWSLEQQLRRIESLRGLFGHKMRQVSGGDAGDE